MPWHLAYPRHILETFQVHLTKIVDDCTNDSRLAPRYYSGLDMPKWPNDLRHQAIRSSHALIIEAKGLRVFAVVVVDNDEPQLFAPSRDRDKRPIIEN